MIQQVLLHEKYMNAMGAIVERFESVFAFGNHPDTNDDPNIVHPVTMAKAFANPLRIIMDELLVGNYLEEIQCRDVVDDDAFSFVPIGATPDDIARCAVAKDILKTSCPGSNPLSVCICQRDGGCLVGTDTITKGSPVGVLDADEDGAADLHRFIPDAVQLKCGSIMLPTEPSRSYWYPSGNQQVPAVGGFDALGPAVILWVAPPPNAPLVRPEGVLPTNADCSLVFNPRVVDKSGDGVCAPAGGDISGSCSPGDTSAFTFKTEPLTVTLQVANPMVVPRTGFIGLKTSGAVDPATYMNCNGSDCGAIQITPAPPAGTTVAPSTDEVIRITWGAQLPATTPYTITISTALKDYWGSPLPQMTTINFTTGA
jgi:hypothetical protein